MELRARCAPLRLRTAASFFRFQPFDPGRLNLQGNDFKPGLVTAQGLLMSNARRSSPAASA